MGINLNNLISDAFAGATIYSKPTSVTAKHLSKVWRIDTNTAQRTLDVTTQLLCRTNDPNLSRNYSTNDQMIQYKRIDQHFS